MEAEFRVPLGDMTYLADDAEVTLPKGMALTIGGANVGEVLNARPDGQGNLLVRVRFAAELIASTAQEDE